MMKYPSLLMIHTKCSDDPKVIPYKILQDYLARECILRVKSGNILQDLHFLQVSRKTGIFLAVLISRILAKIFLPNDFKQDSCKTLAYTGRLANFVESDTSSTKILELAEFLFLNRNVVSTEST